MAPKIHVKPQVNKVHNKAIEIPQPPIRGSSLKQTASETSKDRESNKTKESRIFEVTQTYRSSLPPLRVSKRIEETAVNINSNSRPQSSRKFLLEEIEPSSVSIVRHSYHEDMRSPMQVDKNESRDKKKPRNVSFDIYDNLGPNQNHQNNNRTKNDDLYIYENSDFV